MSLRARLLAAFAYTLLVVIVRGLWVWYLLVSVRVKNTFTN